MVAISALQWSSGVALAAIVLTHLQPANASISSGGPFSGHVSIAWRKNLSFAVPQSTTTCRYDRKEGICADATPVDTDRQSCQFALSR